MLDQNTDRMWYVIGAVIVGAGIILLANKVMPELFASVGESMTGALDKDTIQVTEDFEVIGESNQDTEPTPDVPSDIEGVNDIDVGQEQLTLTDYGVPSLHNIEDMADRLYYDSEDELWKIERSVKHVVFGKDYLMTGQTQFVRVGDPRHREVSIFYRRVPDKEYMTPYQSNYFNGDGVIEWMNAPVNHLGETTTKDDQLMQLIGVVIDMDDHSTLESFNQWIIEKENEGKPLIMTYQLKNPTVEVLPEALQDELNERMVEK